MTENEKRAKVVELGLSRKGKNQYTQAADKRLKVDSGYSDCSSFVRWCYLAAGYPDIGGNTVYQITNKSLVEVCLAKSGQPSDGGKLLPGDLLYFMGTDSSRPYKVGHVEMFIGSGKLLGHGSGVGPTQKVMKDYCANRYKSGKGLIKVLRVISSGAIAETPADLGVRNLYSGMAGADVTTLQKALISLGYSCGKWGADGEFGAATQSAVKAFQYDWHLTVDGIVGRETFTALKTAKSEQADPAEDDSQTEDGVKTVVEVFGGTSYVRDQPGKHGRILGVVKTGDSLKYLGTKTADGWHGVSFAGEDAWHSGKFGKLANVS